MSGITWGEGVVVYSALKEILPSGFPCDCRKGLLEE
jgi:hypothetical protein